MAVITFRTKDHPEANGRNPLEGEHQWTLEFPLEDGGFLRVLMGDEGKQSIRQIVTDQILDEQRLGEDY